MHRFLRSIGFSNVSSRKDLDKLLGQIMNEPDNKKQEKVSSDSIYTEMSLHFAPKIGIVIRGEYDKLGFFHLEHYFPFCESSLITSQEDITINRRVDTNAFTGMCDDYRMGISMIFYLQNAVDYLQLHSADNTPHKAKLALSGLSLGGIIMLGIEKTEESKIKKRRKKFYMGYLIEKAKNGDQNAINQLTVHEIDQDSRIAQRNKQEDLYSIVESTFIPYGSESDNYTMIGTIVNWTHVTNTYTNEGVYLLLLNCNDIVFQVAINEKDLTGEPMIGRRFKGTIWMQGHVDFQSLKC